MRYLFILTGILVLGTSCSTMKKASAPAEQQGRSNSSSSSTASPVFIENISFRPGADKQPVSTKHADKTIAPTTSHAIKTDKIVSPIEVLPASRFKYAILLDAPVEDLDERLLQFIDSWYGTRYRLGGSDKAGIDCSALVQSFFSMMYEQPVPRTCKEQYSESARITKARLREGDLVFFKTRGRSVSHVGIYLRNNKFIHASTSGGVMISDLSEEYFAKRYAGAGRIDL